MTYTAPVYTQISFPIGVGTWCGVYEINDFIVASSIVMSEGVVRELEGAQRGRRNVKGNKNEIGSHTKHEVK